VIAEIGFSASKHQTHTTKGLDLTQLA